MNTSKLQTLLAQAIQRAGHAEPVNSGKDRCVHLEDGTRVYVRTKHTKTMHRESLLVSGGGGAGSTHSTHMSYIDFGSSRMVISTGSADVAFKHLADEDDGALPLRNEAVVRVRAHGHPRLPRRMISVESHERNIDDGLVDRINAVVADHAAGLKAAREKAREQDSVRAKALKLIAGWAFKAGYVGQWCGHEVDVVGQHYRDRQAQRVLEGKRVGNMALLVPEPDNKHDMNAVMVFVWDDAAMAWVHAGYVPSDQACLLRGRWTGDFKNVAVARIERKPANAEGHRDTPRACRIALRLTGEVRAYPDYVRA